MQARAEASVQEGTVQLEKHEAGFLMQVTRAKPSVVRYRVQSHLRRRPPLPHHLRPPPPRPHPLRHPRLPHRRHGLQHRVKST